MDKQRFDTLINSIKEAKGLNDLQTIVAKAIIYKMKVGQQLEFYYLSIQAFYTLFDYANVLRFTDNAIKLTEYADHIKEIPIKVWTAELERMRVETLKAIPR